jgi:hypothetical protein
MAVCKVCKKDYGVDLERHYEIHFTDLNQAGKYVAHLERRIQALEDKR